VHKNEESQTKVLVTQICLNYENLYKNTVYRLELQILVEIINSLITLFSTLTEILVAHLGESWTHHFCLVYGVLRHFQQYFSFVKEEQFTLELWTVVMSGDFL
jgi:hypothetical protein